MDIERYIVDVSIGAIEEHDFKFHIERWRILMKRAPFLLMPVILISVLSVRSVFSQGGEGDFVDVRVMIPGIIVDLKYAGTDNAFGEALYSSEKCLLRREVAIALKKVQERLEKRGLQLVIWDAYRPLSVQRKMWQKVSDERYVANPAKGSRHNRGAAVDVTLADSKGKLLHMPTDYDDFSEKAHRDYAGADTTAAKNAKLLEEVMASEGFIPLPTEWWHFDYVSWEKYPVLDLIPGETTLPSGSQE